MQLFSGDPTFKKRRKHRADHWIISPLQETRRIFAEPLERGQMGDMGQRGKIAVEIRVLIPHFQKGSKMVSLPRQGARSAVSGDHCNSALERQPKADRGFQVVADTTNAKLAAGHVFPYRTGLSTPLRASFAMVAPIRSAN
jgi:hypothetical protein